METRTVRLGDVATVNPRLPLTKGTVARKIPMEALTAHQRYIDSFIYERYSGGAKFQNGDTLIARITPSLENGKTSYVDLLDKNEIAFGSTEFIVLRAKNKLILPKFLYYIAISNSFRQMAIQSMTGTSGRQRVQNESVINYEFPLPIMDEQKAIVKLLDSIDSKIELNRQINKNLLQMMENCYRKMLKNAIYNHQSKQSNILTVADNIITGKTPSTKNPGYYGGDTPFITIPDMQGNVFVTVTKKRLTQSGTSVQKNKEIPALSLNVSCIGTVGLVTINPTVAHTNQQINSVIVSKDKLWELFFELRSLKGVMENMASGGTTILNMNKAIFSKLQINLLSPAIRKQFNAYANPIFEQILINDEQNHKLAKVRDLLLPKLLAGEINISFIEEAIKNA